MATSDVRWFTSEMLGAPAVSSAAGTVKDMLKTVLTLGFNQHNVSSVVIDGTGLATVTTATAHGFPVHSVVKLEGSDQAVMNDDWRVTATDEFTFQFQTESPDLVVTGTMTAKFAPVPYWSVQAEEGNHIAFKSLDPTASGKTWVVEDDATDGVFTSLHRKAVSYFSMVENFVDFTTPKIGRGHFWTIVCNAPGYLTRTWAVFADSRFIYFMLNPSTNTTCGYTGITYNFLYVFGDINSFRQNHADDVILTASNRAKGIINDDFFDSDAFPSDFASLTTNNSAGKFFVRSLDGQSTGVACTMFGSAISSSTGSGGFAHPEPATQKTILHDIICREAAANMRGSLPGAKQLCHTYFSASGTLFDHEDRTYFALNCRGWSVHGQVWIDIVGPWR